MNTTDNLFQNNEQNVVCRNGGRLFDQLRPVRVTYDAFGYASGSVLFEIGYTKVLCAASMQPGVPPFLKGSKTGWLSAEYAMLPTSTAQRTQRESLMFKRSGRCTEISRIIGRALRAVTMLDGFGERTITIDCDVLQADGGTRTAAISGSCLALRHAQQRWLHDGTISKQCVLGDVAAISVGIVNGCAMVDLDCAEDNRAEADFNFVLTSHNDIVEIQGSVEKCGAIAWSDFEHMRQLAADGVKTLFSIVPQPDISTSHDGKKNIRTDNVPFFSLKNRSDKSL